MDEDFNTAGALGQLFDLVRTINQARAENASDEQLAPAQTALRDLSNVLGLMRESQEKATTVLTPLLTCWSTSATAAKNKTSILPTRSVIC